MIGIALFHRTLRHHRLRATNRRLKSKRYRGVSVHGVVKHISDMLVAQRKCHRCPIGLANGAWLRRPFQGARLT
jgi:hypothetical protein